MSLSAREQRILEEIGRELASSWPPCPARPAGRRAARRRRALAGNDGWFAAMSGGLLAALSRRMRWRRAIR